MTARTFTVDVTTAADGTAEAYSPYLSGHLESIHYVKDDFADGVDFTITAEATGESLWTEDTVNASAVRRPRAPLHSQAGVALVYTSDNNAQVGRIALSRDRVKIAIAQGGDTKSGQFLIVVSE